MKISRKLVIAVMAIAAAIIPIVAPSNVADALRDVFRAIGGLA